MATNEKVVNKQYSISSIEKQYKAGNLRNDYPTQRERNRWSLIDKSEEMSDILQGNAFPQLVFAEQMLTEKSRVIWVLDGQQRLTNPMEYRRDGFRISKKVKRYMIQYIENGEIKEFDIRGKKYSELPEVMQEMINDFTFSVQLYLDCTNEDIEYNMDRYNRGTRPNVCEKGIITLGSDGATMIRDIKECSFFDIEKKNYTKKDRNNGNLLKAIAQSVMAVFFKDKWKEKVADMYSVLKDNLTDTEKDKFMDMVDELDEHISDESRNLFTSSLSFLYFGGLKVALNLGLSIEQYANFLDTLVSDLHSKGISKEITVIDEDGNESITTIEESWDDLTSDRKHNTQISVFDKRLDHLRQLMVQYFNVNEKEVEENINVEPKEFLKNLFGDDVAEEIDVYEEALDEYLIEVDYNSQVREKENRPSMLAIVVYAWKQEVDPVNWFASYFAEHTTYNVNQKENYEAMKLAFQGYYSLMKTA